MSCHVWKQNCSNLHYHFVDIHNLKIALKTAQDTHLCSLTILWTNGTCKGEKYTWRSAVTGANPNPLRSLPTVVSHWKVWSMGNSCINMIKHRSVQISHRPSEVLCVAKVYSAWMRNNLGLSAGLNAKVWNAKMSSKMQKNMWNIFLHFRHCHFRTLKMRKRENTNVGFVKIMRSVQH